MQGCRQVELSTKFKIQRPLNFFSFVINSVLITLGASLLVGCEEKIKPSIASVSINREFPSQESWNAVLTFTDSGRLTAVLRAGYIASYNDRKFTLLDSNLTVDFYDEHGNHSSVLTSRKGRVDDYSHNLEAEGNVVVVSNDSTILKTEILYWDNKTQRAYSHAYVEIVSPTEQIQGHGFESDRGLRNYKVLRVTGKAITNR